MKISNFTMALMVAALMSAGNVMAGEVFCNYNITMDAQPTGVGKVYVATEENETPQMSDSYSKKITVKGNKTVYGTITFVSLYSKANDGWVEAGFTRDENGNGQFDEDTEEYFPITAIDDNGNCSGSGSLVNGINEKETKAEAEAQPYPENPNNKFIAFFSKSAAMVAPSCIGKGTVKSSKIVNQVGDEVTFTATAGKDDANGIQYKFTKWTTDSQGNDVASTDAEMTITVSSPVKYFAWFDVDNTDGINDVKNIKDDDDAAYNQSGQRVDKSYKGIVIRHGRKYVAK